MPKIKYQDRNFQADSAKIVEQCNTIIAEYDAQGFVLTLRQLYYQLVTRDIIANKQSEYKRIGSIVNDARLAGVIDWLAIEDRTRNLRSRSHWNTPGDIISSAAASFHMDLWEDQDYRPEVWIEKDALVGVIEQVCEEYDVPYFSCRGYTSQSEMWVASQRIKKNSFTQTPIIFHFGDHDPSGKDMTRDIVERLKLFMGGVELERLALNMDQVEQYHPPPNPAKTTDSRYQTYIAEFGEESWELDALEPAVLADLIRGALDELIDQDLLNEKRDEIEKHREMLTLAAKDWKKIVKVLTKKKT